MNRAFAVALLVLAYCAPCNGGLSPKELKEAVLAPSPGAALPLNAVFAFPGGMLTLGDAIAGKPAALILADYRCHYTCGTALALAAASLSGTGLEAGRDYNLLVIGIDPKDSVADAEAVKAARLAPYPALLRPAKFLNGSAASIASVTDALGYKPVYDAERGEFAHPLGVVILTASGRVSHVIGGLKLDAFALRAALLDARESRLSSLIEGIRLLCYGHDPIFAPYGTAIQTALRGGGVVILLGIGAAILFLVRGKGAQS
jgi:protein SCO1